MMPTVDRDLVEAFLKLDTTCVSDAMDRLGLRCGLHGIKPVLPGKVICGPAFTVRYIPCGQIRGSVGDFLDEVPEGHVVVIDNQGRTDCTVWGDLMSRAASIKHLAATVIDGVCRDVPAVQRIGYPIFSRGYYMVTGKDRVEVESVQRMVSISAIQVRPGDLLLGDDSGVLVIPADRAAKVLNIAREINDKELLIEAALKKGIGLKEARAQVNYHQLQSKK